MSRLYLTAIAAGLVSLLGLQPAAAGCCNSWGGWNGSWGGSWGWGNGCCASSYVAVAPAVTYVQPAPVIVQPAPIVVQPAPVIVRPQPVIVQQPQVIMQDAPVPLYRVNQGPVYSGPGPDYAPRLYKPYRPLRAYPAERGYRKPVYRHRHTHAPRHPHYYHYKRNRGPVSVYN